MTSKPTGWSIANETVSGVTLWCQDMQSVLALMNWLHDLDYFSGCSHLLEVLHQPWRYSAEWSLMQLSKHTTDTRLSEMIRDAVFAGDKTADDVLAEFQKERQSVESAARSEGAEHVGSVTTSG